MIQNIFQIVTFLIRASLAAVLVAAGAAKLADTRSFVNTLKGLGVPTHPEFLTSGLSLIVPLLEVGVGLAVVSGLLSTAVNVAVLVLMSSFSLVVAAALRRHLVVSCRCFGALSDSQFSGKGLARSLFLTFLALIVLLSGSIYSSQYTVPLGGVVLLMIGYLFFAVIAAQAAKTMAVLKERTLS